MTKKTLYMTGPDLGGISKTTVAEILVAAHEIAGRDVLCIDGDTASRGLKNRRKGRTTIALQFDDVVSKAAAIRAAGSQHTVTVLDWGAGSNSALGVEPTIAELCDGKSDVRTVFVMCCEASKTGNAPAIRRVRERFPATEILIVRSHKTGSNFDSFADVTKGLPTIDLQRIDPSVMNWLAASQMTKTIHGEEERPALADRILNPAEGYKLIGQHLASVVNKFSQQEGALAEWSLPRIAGARPIETQFTLLANCDLNDQFLHAHNEMCCAMDAIWNNDLSNDPQMSDLELAGGLVFELRDQAARRRAAVRPVPTPD